jgi:transmembrane sensor
VTHSDNADQIAPPQALEIRSEASRWVIARQASAVWTEQDQAALDTWLAVSSANRLAYWRMEAAWKHTERLNALRTPPSTGPSGQKRVSKILGAVASLIAVAILGIVSAFYLLPPASKTYETPVGGRLTITLNDGSKIELNTDTMLRLSGGENGRDATLERGEAYFQINHDANHPFALSVSGHRVVDLGTKFSVRRDAVRVEVALLEGSAKITSDAENKTSHAAVLRPGDVAIATFNSLTVSRKSASDLTSSLAWRHDMLAFKYATLAQAVAEFNRYNRTKIVIADMRAAQLTVYGNFPTKNVAAFADAIQVSFKLHVEKLNGEIVISR